MSRFKGECAHFFFNNCFIYTYDGANAKLSTNSPETDNSVVTLFYRVTDYISYMVYYTSDKTMH